MTNMYDILYRIICQKHENDVQTDFEKIVKQELV
jgi:hypothetical protein